MRDFRALFLGSKLKAIAIILVFIIGIVSTGILTGLLGAPSVVDVENRFGDVSDQTSTIETDLILHNPNPIGIQLGGTTVNYTVAMNDIAMASGKKEGLQVRQGNSTLDFTTQMTNGKIPSWWVSHIRAGEHTQLEIDAYVHSSLLGRSTTIPYSQEINTDIISQFNSTDPRPVNANHPLISDPILYINETSASWGEVSRAETPIKMAFVFYNPKTTPYAITEIGYDITMNNISVGKGTTEDTHVIPSGSERTIEATTVITNPALDEWWVAHLRRNQITDLQIDFYARIELATGDTIRVPLDELTYTERIETDFFGTKNASTTPSEPTSGTPTTTTEDPNDETPTTEHETATPTETTTLTPTVTETSTDDGLLSH